METFSCESSQRRNVFCRNTLLIILVVAYVCVLLALLLFKAASRSLWLDEAYSVYVARHPFSGVVDLLRNDTWPPLYYVFLSFWMRIWGDSELATRSLSLVFFILTLLATYFLIQAANGNETERLLGSWFFAVTALATLHATNCRGYMMLCFISTVSTYYLFRIVQHQSNNTMLWIGYTLSHICGLLTHYNYLFVIFSHCIVCLILFRHLFHEQLAASSASLFLFLMLWGEHLYVQLGYGIALALVWVKPTSLTTILESFFSPFGTLHGNTKWIAMFSWAIIMLTMLWRRKFSGVLESSPFIIALMSLVSAQLLVSYFKPGFVPGRQGIMMLPFLAVIAAKWMGKDLTLRWSIGILVVLSIIRLGLVAYSVSRSPVGTDRWVAERILHLSDRNDLIVLTDLSYVPITYYLSRFGYRGYVVPFPADISKHPGWRNFGIYQKEGFMDEEIRNLLGQLNTIRPRRIVVALHSHRVYQRLIEQLSKRYKLAEEIVIPNSSKTGTFVYKLIVYETGHTPATTPTSHPNRESQR